MARVKHLSVSIRSDIAGRPYVVIQGADDQDEPQSMELKIWADELVLEDLRRK